jgi:toxin ParE1/3/4
MTRKYQLTNDAAVDLDKIYTYSIENFGMEQARDYLLSLNALFDLLADNPRLGRDCSNIKAGYRKHEHRRHTIYYKLMNRGVLIMRILGNLQDQKKHLR